MSQKHVYVSVVTEALVLRYHIPSAINNGFHWGLLPVSKAQNPMEKRAVAYFRLGSHPSLSATLRCLFTIRM